VPRNRIETDPFGGVVPSGSALVPLFMRISEGLGVTLVQAPVLVSLRASTSMWEAGLASSARNPMATLENVTAISGRTLLVGVAASRYRPSHRTSVADVVQEYQSMEPDSVDLTVVLWLMGSVVQGGGAVQPLAIWLNGSSPCGLEGSV
jgi:hypothetical protein